MAALAHMKMATSQAVRGRERTVVGKKIEYESQRECESNEIWKIKNRHIDLGNFRTQMGKRRPFYV